MHISIAKQEPAKRYAKSKCVLVTRLYDDLDATFNRLISHRAVRMTRTKTEWRLFTSILRAASTPNSITLM